MLIENCTYRITKNISIDVDVHHNHFELCCYDILGCETLVYSCDYIKDAIENYIQYILSFNYPTYRTALKNHNFDIKNYKVNK